MLATRNAEEKVTTRGDGDAACSGSPRVGGRGRNALWVALTGDAHARGDRPLLRLDLASGTIERRILVGGQASYLAHVGNRLFASVEHVGGSGSGPSLIVALDWQSGVVLPLGESHLSDTDAQEIDGPVDQVVRAGNFLWALESGPADCCTSTHPRLPRCGTHSTLNRPDARARLRRRSSMGHGDGRG